MLVTEEEAEGRYCPAQLAGADSVRCASSNCMAWRWLDNETETRELILIPDAKYKSLREQQYYSTVGRGTFTDPLNPNYCNEKQIEDEKELGSKIQEHKDYRDEYLKQLAIGKVSDDWELEFTEFDSFERICVQLTRPRPNRKGYCGLGGKPEHE